MIKLNKLRYERTEKPWFKARMRIIAPGSVLDSQQHLYAMSFLEFKTMQTIYFLNCGCKEIFRK